jgi:hypothetical protein
MNKVLNKYSNYDSIDVLTEGNPGAIRVVCEMKSKDYDSPIIFQMLDDMNIRGPKIWIGYKDHCKQNIDKFIDCLVHKDKDFLETIERNSK